MKRSKQEIWVYNKGQVEKEPICAERWMRLIYENPVGSATLPFLFKRKMLSRFYGMYCRTPLSARGIPKFIRENRVDMAGFSGPYRTYADFFAREHSDVRFPAEPGVLGSPCEGLVSARAGIDPEQLIAAKGSYFQMAELFADEALANGYKGGSMLSIRLTPANYHRVHFFDDGVITASKNLNGDLFSVNPLALKRIARLYCRNKRALTEFSSQNFGDAVLVEIGATFVGSIIHCFESGETVRRGQQASYFQPGGSLLLVFFKKNAFTPNECLLERTANGYETKVAVGEALGTGARRLS